MQSLRIPVQAQPSGGAKSDDNVCQCPHKLGGQGSVETIKLTPVQDQAIAARMALVVGATTFDRLFAGVEFHEADGDLLYVFARDEEAAAEIEDRFSLHISIIATGILKHEIGIVLVLPKQLAR